MPPQHLAQGCVARKAAAQGQISSLAEAEITKVVDVATEIAARLGVSADHPEHSEMKEMVTPEAVLDPIEESVAAK